MGKNKKENMEIERKFLIKDMPQMDSRYEFVEEIEISQYYIAMSKDEQLRLRKVMRDNGEEEFIMTYKKDVGDIERIEEEREVGAEFFHSLLCSVGDNKPLVKTRSVYRYGQHLLEFDKYRDFDLIVCEVEFDSKKEANDFSRPWFLLHDITEEKQYKNPYLWKKVQQVN